MPMPSYLIIEGTNQGKIEGSVKIKGHEGKILVQAVDHSITIPESPQTGLPTGKRIHRPMTITKEIDKSSPKLFQALTSGEQMKTVSLEYYRISPKGTEEKYYTVKLSNAIMTNIRSWTPNCLTPANQQMGHMEDVSFTYEKITWTFEPDGIEAEDSWLAPKA
ncbi:Hcp family type VI secretion system effector [Janthinobacterium sp. PC23-8]|uniref:Hcp family type VI secretion system effector n=1 Tax=Janthinobacterium sp. PC23-8 TaxID=2012679 RepID=UPI000B96D2FB|nr:Hcp family type VI secretion system effector [Janthinobacterium sp. PC23-8]OYO27928.1 Hcp1 family type VI secretion system effector [Janthinobacterium sp. PC23-8]